MIDPAGNSDTPPARRTGIKASIVIPTRNEERNIGTLLMQLLPQSSDRVIEIIVVDGGSTDATRRIVAEFAAREPKVRLIDNPQIIQSAGVNRAAREADPAANLIIRVDAHAGYPDDFITRLLDEFVLRETASIVIPMRTVGRTCFQRAAAAVSNSLLGTGGALHRVGGTSGYVDHGHHSLFDRAAYLSIGGYDESFATNEDAEFDVRLRAAGKRIWFAGDIVIDYFPRSDPLALGRQYFKYGRGRIRTLLKHGVPARLRQFAPPIVTVAILSALPIAMLQPKALLVPLLYLAAMLAGSLMLSLRHRSACIMLAVIVLPVMHLSWGLGFLYGLIERWGQSRAGPIRDTRPDA